MNMKGDLVSNWEYFKDSWNNYATATELSKKSEEIVVATLLSVMGKECHQIYKNLPLSAEERKKPETVLAKLTDHFEPKRNIYERYVFNTVSQDQDESFDQFLNRLRELAATCNFGTLEEEMIRDRIVIGIRDNRTRERLWGSQTSNWKGQLILAEPTSWRQNSDRKWKSLKLSITHELSSDHPTVVSIVEESMRETTAQPMVRRVQPVKRKTIWRVFVKQSAWQSTQEAARVTTNLNHHETGSLDNTYTSWKTMTQKNTKLS